MSFDIQLFNSIADQYDSLIGGATPELARHVFSIAPDLGPDSIVLDNACGPAVLTRQLLRKFPPTSKKPVIHAVDGAERMIENARLKLGPTEDATVSLRVMTAEELDFPDDSFTHSFTIAGIQHFSQPEVATKELYRTLKPGGLAVVTSWAYSGHVDVARAAQEATKPGSPPYQVPTAEKWFRDDYVQSVVESGGFSDVKTHRKDVHFAAPTAIGLRDLMFPFYSSVCADWSDDEKAKFKEEMLNSIQEMGKEVIVEDDESGNTAKFALRMTAIVVVAKK
jgi:ubiquinone/menaquinone biosynthesis C-methylase UbiE